MQRQSYDDLVVSGKKELLVFSEDHSIMEIVGKALELTSQGVDVHLVYELSDFPAVFWMIPQASHIAAQAKKEAQFAIKQVNAILGLPPKNLYILSKLEVNFLKSQCEKEVGKEHRNKWTMLLSKKKFVSSLHERLVRVY